MACSNPSPPRIPVFYTLTIMHKPVPVGRPIISGCDGPTEKISSFVDTLLWTHCHSLSHKKQQSYIKDTTDFISSIENTKIGQATSGVQRREIHKGIHPRHQSSLQADGNLSIYPFYLVPPSGDKKRLYQRRSNKTAYNIIQT